ncbi:tripartite motif-containing 31 [Chelydra serpentina]|uniref:Tripartite motif-containing 31 n=1 Tax=Chelydra serpentina TaxID=8475 RepID=A0A8T1S5H5_CHESE|nr:tripartite motif-containing 31 [Chelydra serpentina]
MAGSDLVQELQLEVTCSICSKYMEVPVTLDCGHNYCQACILQQCPQCRRPFRQRSFRPNKLLANVTAIAKRFPSQDEAQDERPRSIPLGGEEPMGQDPQGQQVKRRELSAAGGSGGGWECSRGWVVRFCALRLPGAG